MEKLIRRYIAEYPYLSNRRLANLIVEKENLDVSPDSFRKLVAKIRYQDIKLNDDVLVEKSETELPESLYTEDADFILPEIDNRMAILNDIHIPFQDNRALLIAIKYIKEWSPTTIILNGDIMDCYSVSSYSRDPAMRDFKKEIDLTKQFLRYLRENFEGCNIYYKFGNHENRLQFYLWRNAEELSGLEEIQLQNLLELYNLGIKHIGANQLILGGSLYFAHGHEIYASGGMVNVARNIRLKAFDNIIFGHFHKTQEDIITTISGKTIGAWSVGCLCGLRPAYRPVSFWNHGFALVERQGKMFEIQNRKIVLGRVV